ncbi:hypothetical protein MSAN_02164600 [Mycena sanguinolenta]|uniref:Uncharacterized protein n=1 Tax=Mycena sanguinolenta TaxID=230812 RepID=A0A8H6XFC7_9AGAR|nr:hypothetical protein MSAN_02164600 [Mycena sanguinolenta]
MSNAHADPSSGPQDDSDIFRGDPPPPPRSPSPSRESNVSSSSSSSILGGRLGAIAAIVEHAISRWAGNESSSSSSSSTSDSGSGAHSRATRRTRRSKSEHDISTRISRMQAREESRQIPRQFSLYLPPSLASDANTQHIQTTSDLSSILRQLDTALKRSTRARRQQERERSPPALDPPKPRHLHYMLPDAVKTPSRAASFTDLSALAESQRKGKGKEGQATKRPLSVPKAWFLDVSSPTWDDMRAIGKLLHLHPLTLEDVLMKDPREKLERFPKLGYYFISFRAIESWDNRGKYWDQDGDGREKGVVGEANVYLVVFNEGVCSFHFTDMSDHLDRVRNRIMSLDKVVNMSSDWIAHGILDSIVDSFFPFLQGLEREVMAIEDIVFSGERNPSAAVSPDADTSTLPTNVEKAGSQIWPLELSEKNVARLETAQTHFSLPWPAFLAKWRVHIPKRRRKAVAAKPSPTTSTLHRMARARRLLTSLSRLLSSKSEVIAQLRKRLLTSSQSESNVERAEVAMYLGDVQDHILALENSLSHYERMLSQSHPLYISHVRTTVAISKGGSDKALLFLSAVSIAVLCIQTLIGACSINVHVPQNNHFGHRFNVFGIVIALSILIFVSYLKLVLHWWKTAKRRTGRTTAAL